MRTNSLKLKESRSQEPGAGKQEAGTVIGPSVSQEPTFLVPGQGHAFSQSMMDSGNHCSFVISS